MTIWHADEFAQVATYWAPPTNDGYGGLTYPAPVEVLCRWEDTNEQITTPAGDEYVSQAVVWPAVMLNTTGWLCLGTSVEADPRAQADAYEIRKRSLIPALTGDLEEFKVWL